MKTQEKIYKKINNEFRNILATEFYKKFNVQIETQYEFISDKLISTRKDSCDFTQEQLNWIEAFEKGYSLIMNQILS